MANAPTRPNRPRPRTSVDWSKVGSFRVAIGALIPSALIGWLLGLAWQPFQYVTIPIFVAWWLALVLSTDYVIYCPRCRKRVKVGNKICPNCGGSTKPSAGS